MGYNNIHNSYRPYHDLKWFLDDFSRRPVDWGGLGGGAWANPLPPLPENVHLKKKNSLYRDGVTCLNGRHYFI